MIRPLWSTASPQETGEDGSAGLHLQRFLPLRISRAAIEDAWPPAVLPAGFLVNIMAFLHRKEMEKYFSVVIGSEDIVNPKPDPEGLQLAIAGLGCSSGEVIYIGDSRVDAETAQNAGVTFIALLTGVTVASEFSEYKPVAVLKSLLELPAIINPAYNRQ